MIQQGVEIYYYYLVDHTATVHDYTNKTEHLNKTLPGSANGKDEYLDYLLSSDFLFFHSILL